MDFMDLNIRIMAIGLGVDAEELWVERIWFQEIYERKCVIVSVLLYPFTR